jgi:hypothetical protein
MLDAELTHPLPKRLRGDTGICNCDDQRDGRETPHDKSVAGWEIRPGTDLHTAERLHPSSRHSSEGV